MSEQSRPFLPRLITNPPPTPKQPTHGLPNRSFIYPIHGITHLIAHRSLHPPLYSRIVPVGLLSLFVVAFMFTFLYLPHVVILSLFHEPFPRSAAATMILSESACIVSILAEAFLTEKQIVDVFDIVLLSRTKRVRGLNKRVEAMIRAARILDVDENGDRRLGTHIINPYVKFREAVRIGCYFVLELPLCLVPVVGTALFLCLQGYHLGPLCHYRYFQLLGWDKATKKAFVKRNRFRYFLFGLVHVMLQLIPVASIFFLFSTGTGAALWAVDYEKRNWKETTAGGRPGWSPEEEEEDESEVSEDDQTALLPPPRVVAEGAGRGQKKKSWLAWWRK